MTQQTDPLSQLPWDRRPMTHRDLGVVLALIIMLPLALAGLVFFVLRGAGEPALAMTDSSSAVTMPVAAESRVVAYTVRTVIGADPAMAYIGVGGEIDGEINPDLVVDVGDHNWPG